MTQERQYAEEIFKQLTWGKDRRSGFPKYFSWGMTEKVYGKDEMTFAKDGKEVKHKGKVWVRFSVTGLLHTGRVYVFLTGADDYTVLIVKGKTAEIIHEFDTIYCDELSSVIHSAIEDARF